MGRKCGGRKRLRKLVSMGTSDTVTSGRCESRIGGAIRCVADTFGKQMRTEVAYLAAEGGMVKRGMLTTGLGLGIVAILRLRQGDWYASHRPGKHGAEKNRRKCQTGLDSVEKMLIISRL